MQNEKVKRGSKKSCVGRGDCANECNFPARLANEGWDFSDYPGCFYSIKNTKDYDIYVGGKHATGFLFRLLSLLPASGTVQMPDVTEYAKWLKVD